MRLGNLPLASARSMLLIESGTIFNNSGRSMSGEHE
jgi:hypothetical protein